MIGRFNIGWGYFTELIGLDERFIFTVKTDNAGTSLDTQFTIPTSTTGITEPFLYDIETSDGQTITGVTGNHTITFPTAGTYDVKISGSFPYIRFNNEGDNLKLLDIKNFGIYALGSKSQDRAFNGCSNLVINATDIGHFENVTNFYVAWEGCTSLTTFPLIDTSSGNNFGFAWQGCTSLTTFPLLDTSSVGNFVFTWFNCTSLTTFPLLDTSSCTNFGHTWRNCTSLTSFPANAFDTNIASNYTSAFNSTNLTTQSIDDILVSLDTSGVLNGTFTQSGGEGPSYIGSIAINNLTAKGWTITTTTPVTSEEFVFTVKTDNAGTSGTNQFTIPTNTTGITEPFLYDIETSDGQTITGVTGDTTITFPTAGTYDVKISGSFPYIYFNNAGDKLKLLEIKNFGIYALDSTSQLSAFWGCSNLIISATDIGHFENVTDFQSAWNRCSSLTSFPLIDTSSGLVFTQTWQSCTNLISLPLIDTSNGLFFSYTWRACSSLTTFPLLDTSNGTNFFKAWEFCSSLTSFPSNAFDINIASNYIDAFLSTNLTTQSIDDILVSLDTSGVLNGTFAQSGGQAPSATGQTAITNLVGKGWTITTTT